MLSSKRFEEYISSIYAEENKYRIIAASGEGTIQVQIDFFNKFLPLLSKDCELVIGIIDFTIFIQFIG